MPVNKVPTANLTNYSTTVDPNTGEVVVTARFQGVDVDQRVQCTPPCILFFSPTTGFHAGHLPDGVEPNWQVADVIQSIT